MLFSPRWIPRSQLKSEVNQHWTPLGVCTTGAAGMGWEATGECQAYQVAQKDLLYSDEPATLGSSLQSITRQVLKLKTFATFSSSQTFTSQQVLIGSAQRSRSNKESEWKYFLLGRNESWTNSRKNIDSGSSSKNRFFIKTWWEVNEKIYSNVSRGIRKKLRTFFGRITIWQRH